MKTKFGKLISFITVIAVAIFICTSIIITSDKTAAQPSFVGSLPAGYTAYPGQLKMGKSCTCATGGITGAPSAGPLCETSGCFGSSRTRYGWLTTNTPGIQSTVCNQLSRAILPLPPCFQLDGDDAVVISGSISPLQNLSYYSFNLYESLTYDNQYPSNYAALQRSVNLGFNNVTLKKGTNGKYIIIVSANTNTVNVVKDALRATGVPDQIMNTYLVPASVTNVGNASYPDQLSLSLRLSFQSETERQNINTFTQQSAPGTAVLFIKGPGIDGDITEDTLPKWEDTLRANNIEYSTGLDQKLKALEQAVISIYTRQGYSLKARIPENLLHVDPIFCSTEGKTCVYDSPDALYSSFPCDFSPSVLRNSNCEIDLGPANSNDVVMWLGVDHTLVGDKTLASYFSAESQTFIGSNDEKFSLVGLYTQGSANQYLQRQQADKLYAVKITRSCNNTPYCVAVPYLGTGSNETGFVIVGRIYLDKATGSGPNPANLIPATLLWLTKS